MRRTLLLPALLVTAALLPALPAAPATSVSDTLSVVKDDQPGVGNGEFTVLVSAETPVVGDAVMIARDDEFADALASGLLQREGPMFTVPSGGPVPDIIRERIGQVAPQRAVILGGEAAVSPAVAAELADLGLQVERLAGLTRFDTAVEIAQAEAPDADTIMLARAFPSPASGDPTQAFADTLAAGGLSAREAWPILLTQTEELTAPTAEYLRRSGASRVVLLGGTAAISPAVEQQVREIMPTVERVAGATRFETAAELEKFAGADDASEVDQVILVEGTSTPAFTQDQPLAPDPWAAGFASANRAFVFDAPILLTASGSLPDPTAAFLAPGVGGDPAQAPLITCTMPGPACEEGRQAAGLPPAVEVTANPDRGTLVPGQQVPITITGIDGPVTVGGGCLADSAIVEGGQGTVTAATDLPPQTCEIVVGPITLPGGATQTETFTYESGDGQAPVMAFDELSSICGLAVDGARDRFYVIECGGDLIHRYDGDLAAVAAPITLPTGSTNDVDLDVITAPTTFAGVAVPAGSLLAVDGEVEEGALVFDPADGSLLAGPLDLEEAGETVGVAWDALNGQIVEVSWEVDTISRLDPADGSLDVAFPVTPDGSWDVFFGDIEVGCNGHLFLVSSSEPTVLEVASDGTVVTTHEIPGETAETVGSHASIAIDEQSGTTYVGLNNTNTLVAFDTLPIGTC